MSNRSAHNRHDGNKGFPKTQRKYVPKAHNSTPREPDINPTLSNSLRQSFSQQSDAAATSSGGSGGATTESTSRVRMGENGEWVSGKIHGGNFVNYLPQDEAVAAGLGADEGGLDPVDSQRVVDLLNRELSRLLKLNPRDFWRELANDFSLHEFLESFLKFRSRWYDFPHRGAKGIVAGVIVGEFELSRRVFMILYRISSNRDPGARAADSLSPKDHAALLQEKKLVDLPKLFDICAIYGHENEDLTRSLVMNALKAQPRIHDNFTAALSHFLSIVHTMHQRCSSSLEVLFSSHGLEDHGSRQLHTDYLEVMDFINDAIVSMDAFVSAYEPAAVFFACPVEMSYGNEELLSILARLHDSLLPSLQRGFRIIFTAGEGGHLETFGNMLSSIALSLKMLSMRIVKFGWKLLDLCYLSDEVFEGSFPLPAATKMFPANVEDPVIRADILVQTFREISGGYSHVEEGQNRGTFLQNVEKNHKIMSRIEFLQNTGWILVDDEQFQYLSMIMKHPLEANIKELPHATPPATSNKLRMDEDAAIIESKISQIKDLFPDYGKGFLSACLEVYNQNPEEVIQRILEGTLHEDLRLLDTTLEKIPPPKSASVSRNDKGKGKLLESTTPPFTNTLPTVKERQTDGPSFSSSSTVGRYVRKSAANLPDSKTLNSRDEKDLAKTAALISQLEYEDEYDDSFDDLGLSVADSGLEETEILGDKMNSSREKSWETDTGSSALNASNSKWNSRKKPQFYVKDGKNYSYKVAGSVAVANYNEASLVNEAQKELIHGLGRGGNLPLGAVRRLTELNEVQDDEPDATEGGGRGIAGNARGRGRRGGGRNNYRKDRAMKKHFSGLTGH
uniref:CUE domain-containing protein n=1 Tax=Davidia involucrata TaxID=16924 RepID=A0A5B7BHE9_DAVIN